MVLSRKNVFPFSHLVHAFKLIAELSAELPYVYDTDYIHVMFPYLYLILLCVFLSVLGRRFFISLERVSSLSSFSFTSSFFLFREAEMHISLFLTPACVYSVALILTLVGASALPPPHPHAWRKGERTVCPSVGPPLCTICHIPFLSTHSTHSFYIEL